MSREPGWLLSAAIAVVVTLCAADSLFLRAERGPKEGEWHHFSGDQRSTKYSPLAQISKENVKALRVAWRWPSPDREVEARNVLWRASKYEDTPLYVNGVLYTVTTLGMIAALDPATGQTRWLYDPESYKSLTTRPANGNFSNRGMEYWTDGRAERLLLGTVDAYLLSIDMKTGKPDPAFGEGGKVDLTAGIRKAVRGTNFVARRPLVARDTVIIGSAIADTVKQKDDNPPGYVQAYDVRTGKKVWTFHTIPLKGEAGYDTWIDGSAADAGAANVWAGITYDDELDYVYLASSTPSSDFYGGHRPGDNLFAESLICVEAKTGKRVWHFQAVHHGLWDYDFPADPVLADITVNGRRVKAVAAVTKQAFTYVFDRKTGKPVWPIEERPVPQSTVPGEVTSKTQPFPTKPPAFDLQGTTENNLIDFTPELRKQAAAQLATFEHGPLFMPPSLKGTVFLPGVWGGARWGGGAFDPDTAMFYVSSVSIPAVSRLTPGDPKQTNLLYRGGGGGSSPNLQIDGLPIFKPPYSRVTAIDLNKGELRWMTPLGNGPRNHPLLKGLNPPPLGSGVQLTHLLLTKTLLFVSVTYMASSGAVTPPTWAKWGDPDMMRELVYVFDKPSGQLLHTIQLDGAGVAQPMTYLHAGKQYVLVAAGGAANAELVALNLPGPTN